MAQARFSRRTALIVVAALAAVLATVLIGFRAFAATGDDEPRFAGSATCASCHAPQFDSWKTSQHAVAMQEARPATVLGRFDGARVKKDGVTSTFTTRDGRLVVNTEDATGKLRDFDVRYTFGVWPLQQYLVETGRGHIQSLSLAWDARPAAQGGQRWFSLDTTAHVTANDRFHWTGRALNWNHMCADCHSTGVRKGYDAAADSFRTTWSEINVSCESCHGPGSAHVARMDYPKWLWRLAWSDGGLAARLDERRDARWTMDPATGTARRNRPRTTDREIETCAQCHARRLHVAEGYTAGKPLMDFYDPELLVAGLYHPDGQQDAEVFTWGSFVQSRMYAAGVTCADCHDSHTGKLSRPGKATCTQCHLSAKYDAPAHTLHRVGSVGADCVACHMPTTTYMQVDPRHDHSMRVPRPDLTVRLGVPNACGSCHAERGPAWAAERIRDEYGREPVGFQRFAGAFAADDAGDPASSDSLITVANDPSQPAIVRASALARLGRYPGPRVLEAARRWSSDGNPLVRRAALQVLETASPPDRVAIAVPRLRDSIRSVRLEAAWLVAPMADSLTAPADREAFANAAREFVASARYNADRLLSRTTLGTFYVFRGHLDSAAAEFSAAARLDSRAPESYLYLAEVRRMQGRLAEAERVIRDGLALIPGDPGLRAALDRVRRERQSSGDAR
ncbi:MAG TPA: multiheme c-type cytochrome [Gemmatimonadaceae bacterium]|nr:multiheme c-type cytochrome [Gemmatimonadaceae bacterium]